MNINAKQINELATSRFDITTALSFFGQMKAIVERDATLVTTLDTVWTTYTAAYTAFDDAYAQTRKWIQTEDIETLDKTRDSALSAYLNALKSMTQSPNAAKQQAAKLLQFIREKYQLAGSDEYMKETTARPLRRPIPVTTATAINPAREVTKRIGLARRQPNLFYQISKPRVSRESYLIITFLPFSMYKPFLTGRFWSLRPCRSKNSLSPFLVTT